jgi:hypothetical protein
LVQKPSDLRSNVRICLTPNNSRVARTFPLSMSLLAQSGIEHVREPYACFLQLLRTIGVLACT